MLGRIFGVMVSVSVVTGFFCGNLEEVAGSLINGVGEGVSLTLSLMGTMCFWNGIMSVFDECGITKALTRAITPAMKLVYSERTLYSEAGQNICASFAANFLGLGNAALPLGVKTMESLCRVYGGKASADMMTYAVLNTAPFQLIPTTLIALRGAHGAKNPFDILLPSWICSAMTVCFGVIACRLFGKLFFKEDKQC